MRAAVQKLQLGEGGAIAAFVVPVLVVIVVFPLTFILLQAIFPNLGAGSLAEPFSRLADTFSDPRIGRWTLNTIMLGSAVVFTAALVAVPLGVLRGLFRVPLAGLWDVMFLIPFAIPPYIAALGWIMTLQPRGYLDQMTGINLGQFLFSFWGVVFVMTLNVFPVVYFAVSRTMATIGGRYVEAARVAGANPTIAFFRITLPLATPAIAASLLLVFAMAIEEFGTPAALAARSGFLVLVTGIEQKLSDYPIDLPGAALLSTILVGLAMCAFALQAWVVTRRDFRTLSGKPKTGDLTPLGNWTVPVVGFFALIAFLGAIVPVAAVFLTASTRTISGGLAWDNFSTIHFEAILANRGGAMQALQTSLGLGLTAAALTGIIGTLTAYVVVRHKSLASRMLDFLTLAPNTIPGIVVAVGLILAWTQPWLPFTPYNTIWVLVLAYCCLLLPYPVRYANAALRQIGTSLEDAARVSGANAFVAFVRIIVPLISPSVIAAMLLVFAVAARELVATILLAPIGTRTVALFIWRQFEQGSVGLGMAMSTIAIAITMTIPILVTLWMQRADNQPG
ncbi:ABC transporter permease [Pelagibacterium lentulum]|uniref:ABC transporter permease n=1 Tax=Pelagibacterium lentulum TaxID=2029865 RepID=A0A916RLB5_9HYPH|nr:iron ABC transporter permease [Pelagibacterium lentulum]GGA60910.1 ABC transporter permease [Pelagibacterium lentulum]